MFEIMQNKMTATATILIGLQASGKSTFSSRHLSEENVIISLDILKSRSREKFKIDECITKQQSFIIDNINITKEDRGRYIAAAKTNNYQIHGYFFVSTVKDAVIRNRLRDGTKKVPDVAIFSAAKRLEMPVIDEGFDQLFSVRIDGVGGFRVEKMKK